MTTTTQNGDRVEKVGEFTANGETRSVTVTLAASGAFWTTWDGIAGGRDFARRSAAVKHLKNTLSQVVVTWFE